MLCCVLCIYISIITHFVLGTYTQYIDFNQSFKAALQSDGQSITLYTLFNTISMITVLGTCFFGNECFAI